MGKWFVVLAAGLWLSGCAATGVVDQLAFVPDEVTPGDAVVSEGFVIESVAVDPGVVTPKIEKAYRASFHHTMQMANVFGGARGAPYSFQIEIQRSKIQGLGASLSNELAARIVLRSPDGQVVMDEVVISEGKAGALEEFAGSDRVRLALGRLSQNHFDEVLRLVRLAVSSEMSRQEPLSSGE